MTARLAVRLVSPSRDIHITRRVADVSWREEVPGGFASATVQLQQPLSLTPAELQYYSKLYIYDARNGDTMWEGRVEDLGRGSDASGQVWTVDAVGGSAHALDTTVPLIYQDVSLDGWSSAPGAPPWLDNNQGAFPSPSNGAGLQVTAPPGTYPAGAYPALMYRPMGDAGLRVAAVNFTGGEDVTNAAWSWQTVVSTTTTPTGASQASTHTYAAGSFIAYAAAITSDFPAGCVYPYLQISTTGGTVTSDTHRVSLVSVLVRSTLFTQAGAEIVTGGFYDATQLKASLVVADLLGRGLLPLFDGAHAFIDTVADYTFAGSLAYPGGVTASGVLSDLMTLLPTMFWAAWESDDTTGLYRFEWREWPTTVRYETTARDGFSSPGSAADLYDTVAVTWTDPLGNPQTTVSTLPNPILTAAGFHRTARIALPDGLSGADAATQAGQQFLTQHAVPPSAGTLSVARPIYDRQLGRMVAPWEIRPGNLVLVRDVAPTTTVNGDRDGISVFRVVAKTYSSADNTAVLELDAPAQTLVAQTAALLRR